MLPKIRQYAIASVESVQSVSPIGAAVLFILAYVAAWLGIVAALLVIVFLVGLHFAKRPIGASTAVVELQRDPTPFEQLTAAGLICSKVEFKAPSAARQRKAESAV